MARAMAVKVLPAPTAWSYSTAESVIPRQMALSCQGRILITSSGTFPGKVKNDPSRWRTTRVLNFSLKTSTKRSRRASSAKAQSRNSLVISVAFICDSSVASSSTQVLPSESLWITFTGLEFSVRSTISLVLRALWLGVHSAFAEPVVTMLNVLVAGACKDDKLEPTTTVLRFGADPLKFDPVFADSQPRRKTVSVINDGRSTAEVSWQVPDEPIFLIDPPSVLPPGETELTVEFIPKVPGRLSRTLSVKTGDSRPVVLAIDAAARAIPQCVPTSTCATSSFDTTLQRCVETTVADGTSCDPQSACITGATCVGGRCIGAPKTCDDGNQCTIDVCNATLGCEFLPAPPCPGDGKCMQGVCDPVKGCGLAPMADGTTCGTLQTCLAAEICIEGACVVRDPPEGYVCAQASPCQDRGVCVNDVCVRPPATALLPSWSFDAAAVDAGTTTPQLHDFVMEPNGDMTLGGFFQTPVILRANTSSAKPTPLGVSRRCILWGPRLVCADYPASPNGRVTAIDPATGGTLWSYDVRTDRADFLMVAPQIFLARLVVQTTDRMAAVFEAYPVTTSSNPNTQCRRYFMVTLDAQGRAIAGQRIEDPLLDVCNHPHPYGVAADAVGNIFIAFSPTTSQQAPLKPGTPTLLMSYTRDGVFRWKVTDASMPGGELAVARGLLYPENGSVALLAATGAPAFSLPSALGRIVISDARFIPAPPTAYPAGGVSRGKANGNRRSARKPRPRSGEAESWQ